MINAHIASAAHSDQPEAAKIRPGMATFWVLFATIGLILALMLGIAISSIPSTAPLTQYNPSAQSATMAQSSVPDIFVSDFCPRSPILDHSSPVVASSHADRR